jgi:hypothetical protein
MSNYPMGVTDGHPEFWASDYVPEADDELDYLDRLEQEAAAFPPADFTLELGADFVWTDADIAEYERRLLLRDADPRMGLYYEERRRAA